MPGTRQWAQALASGTIVTALYFLFGPAVMVLFNEHQLKKVDL